MILAGCLGGFRDPGYILVLRLLEYGIGWVWGIGDDENDYCSDWVSRLKDDLYKYEN